MKIKIKWFKETGKFYAEGLVEIGNIQIWENDFKQTIVDNQNCLISEWVNHDFYVMIDTTQMQDDDVNFHGFYTHLFMPDAFKGMKESDTHTNHKGGKQPTCFCGICRRCKRRKWDADHWRKKYSVSDEELEKRLNEKFRKEGWD